MPYSSEREVDNKRDNVEKMRLRAEIKRIANTTLRGTFAVDEDRIYWVKRLRVLNLHLAAIEEFS